MRDILESKLKTFKDGNFTNKDFLAWLRESDLWMASFNCLKLKGRQLDKKELVDILNGAIVEDVPIDLYSFLNNFKELFKDMRASLSMQQSFDERLFNRFYDLLIGGSGYRTTNPFVFKWGFVPPHFTGISEQLNELRKNTEKIQNPIDRAIALHLGIVSIYPYGEDTALMATIAMDYVLMQAGIPLPIFTTDLEEYDDIIFRYLSKDENLFNDMFCRSEINRLDSVNIFGFESQGK